MRGEIAQTVEQRPEKPCVPSSILGFATIFCIVQFFRIIELKKMKVIFAECFGKQRLFFYILQGENSL